MQSAEQTQHIGRAIARAEPTRSHAAIPSGPLRLLHLEDNASDAASLHDILSAAGLASHIVHVSDRSAFEVALDAESYHLILCDFNVPDYDGVSALTIARDRQPDVPVIVISSAEGEDQAVKCLHLGATDYLLKQRLGRLPNAVWRAIAQAEEQRHLRVAESELRASEQRFRLLAQHSREVFWFVGLNPERLLYVSPAIEEIWGVPAARFYENVGLWQSAIHPEDRARVRTAWRACATGEESRFDIEYRVIHTDGSTRLVASTGLVFVDDSRGGAQISGIARDITAQTKLEQELRQSHRMDGIGQLAGGIAHDFNNLLTVIQGNSDLALDELDPSSVVHADIREIKRAATSAAALTKQLLAFSRRQILRPRPVEMRAVALSVEGMLSRLIGDNIDLVLDLAHERGCVMADPGQLEQVIINLTVNARDAMPDGGRITIGTDSLWRHPHGNAAAAMLPYERLTVTDSGTGMDRSTRERIFEPFFTTKAVGRGTGLGLSTVHGIVKQSDGELEVSSAPGLGTTFMIYFPQCAPACATDTVPAQQRVVTGSETVLVVEDQRALRGLVRRILEQRGYEVLEAIDGDDALRVASSFASPIHLVISDVVMPGMSARVMAEEIRAARPDVRLLFMSGYNSGDQFLQNRANTEVDFLQKPFLPYDLAEKVREVLERGS